MEESIARFNNKVIIVTGAASGIGRACAIRFVKEGGSVFCIDLNEKGLQETLSLIQKQNKDAKAHVHPADISDEQSVIEAVAECVKRYQRIDALAHLAGILDFAHSAKMEFSRWRRVLSINLDGTFLICRAVLPYLEKSSGSIVNASSSAALVGLAYGIAYSASKGGVLSLTRSIAMEYVRRGVRANCICPAGITTPMTDNVSMAEGADLELIGRHEMISGKWGTPEQVASVVAMLASEDASHITGEEIRVDGGALS